MTGKHHSTTRRWLVGASALALLAMTVGRATPASATHGHDDRLVVATYNVDFGTDLAPLFTASGADLLAKAQGAFTTMLRSDYASRAEAVATLLGREHPDVIGLQEVAQWTQINPTTGTRVVVADYQAQLLAALARHDLHYTVAVVNSTMDTTLTLTPVFAVRFVDQNLILVRTDGRHPLRVVGTDQGRYEASMAVSSLGIVVTRGWAYADLQRDDQSLRFFTTHLEAYTDQAGDTEKSFYRDQQATELRKMMVRSPLPAIVTGDINSRPTCDGTNTNAYRILTRGAYSEVWAALYGARQCGGFTSGQASVFATTNTLTHRIDDVIFPTNRVRALTTDVIGDETADRTPATVTAPAGLWPSDHAGSVATLTFDHDD